MAIIITTGLNIAEWHSYIDFCGYYGNCDCYGYYGYVFMVIMIIMVTMVIMLLIVILVIITVIQGLLKSKS
jgi:hypothetical protein